MKNNFGNNSARDLFCRFLGCYILRTPHDKNNDNYDNYWPFLFNAIIDGLNLRELEMSGQKYIWANSLPIPTYEKLDRILMATEWE